MSIDLLNMTVIELLYASVNISVFITQFLNHAFNLTLLIWLNLILYRIYKWIKKKGRRR